MPTPLDWTLNFVGLLTGAAVTAMLAAVLFRFAAAYGHSHFRLWALGWAGFTLYNLVGAAAFTPLVGFDPAHPGRVAISFLVQVAGYGSAVVLAAGTVAFVRRRVVEVRELVVPLAAAVVLAALSAYPWRVDPEGMWVRFFLRVSLPSLVAGVAFLVSAGLAWRHRAEEGALFGAAMVLLALAQFHYVGYGLAAMLGAKPGYQIAYFGFVDVVLFSGVAVAMVWMALADERRRTAMNAAAAQDAVAALHRQDLQFRRMIEHSSDIVTVLDQDAVVRYESPSITRILGYGTEECVGKSAFDYLHPEDVPGAFAAFQRGLTTGLPTPHRFRFRHKNGSWVPIEAIGMLGEDENGGQTIVVNSRDRSELTRLEHQLFEAQKMESIGRLAGGVAHDFNNLLTVIKGNGSLAYRRLAGVPEARAEIADILQATDRAAQLTQQLLSFARRQVVLPEVVDVNDVVTRIDRMSKRVMGEDIEIRTTVAAAPVLVRVDPGQFEQVLLNLMVNARDAMPHGGRIDLGVAESALTEDPLPAPDFAPGPYAVVTVRDTGGGMPDEVKRRLFEPFFTTKPTGQGTGLGLASSYGIVRQAGGHLLVESEVNQGTCFTIYLPVVTVGPVEPATGPAKACSGGHEVVLVVEDEPAVRHLAVRVLRNLGYLVVEADDGQAGLAAAEHHAVDVVVTDIVMPRLGGVAMVERLRAGNPGLPVVFTSGYASETKLIATLPPSSAFLQKPYSPDELADRVRALLDQMVAR